MAQENRGGIKWWLVIAMFFIFPPVAAILLILKLLTDFSAPASSGQTPRTRTYSPPHTQSNPAKYNAQTVEYRPVQTERSAAAPSNQQRVQETLRQQGAPAQPQPQVQAQPQPQGAAMQDMFKNPNRPQRPAQPAGKKIPTRGGRFWEVLGYLTIGTGVLFSALTLLGAFGGFDPFAAMIVLISTCAPGAALALLGSGARGRAARCRQYLIMIGDRRSVDVKALANSIPVSLARTVRDLRWMQDKGLLPHGMFLDAATNTLRYAGDPPPEPKKRASKKADSKKKPAETTADGKKVYAEERRIRELNDMIVDAHVSERMDKLELLTHKILAYADEHPEKEGKLRQFRQHYLPTTIKILESYERLERQGVAGENISSAMKDVEKIMDKLVRGFEKQLDGLFDAEAMDISTDVSVLESMMRLEGLHEGPFGLRHDDDMQTETK